MSRERYQRVKQIFLATCDLPTTERPAALDRSCGADRSLRSEVESLLANFDAGATDARADSAAGLVERPKHVGPYRVLHEIGRGGMGVVYLARREDDQFRRLVAVKVLKRGMDTEDVLRRFDLEQQVLAALNHPGIARLHEAGETAEGTPYFVMEHVEGLDLLEYGDAHRLRLEERLRLFTKVCAAVHHAHQSLVVHRDLKPANILVTRHGEPKLLDFGIAKLLEPTPPEDGGAPANAARTAGAERLMTPEYASPEQVRGEPVSTASDVYALGVLLYRLVCGRAPYELPGRAPAEIERVVCETLPPRPSVTVDHTASDDATGAPTPESVSRARATRPDRLRRALEGDIDNIVMMAIRKPPPRRYASALAVAEDIERHLTQRPVIARAPSVGYRMSRFVRRHRMGATAAIVATLVVASGAAATITGWLEAGTRRDEAHAAETVAIDLQHRATAARQRAEHRLGQVRELARAFVFDFHELVRDLDETGATRRLMVETALAYLGELAADVADDEPLALELATFYDQVGDIQGGSRGPTLGDETGAAASYVAALALRTAVLAASPADPGARAAIATSHERLGTLARRRGDDPAALAAHREALAIRAALLAEDPTDDHRRATARSHATLAELLLATGDVETGFGHDDQGLALRRALVADRADTTAARRELASACAAAARRRTEVGWHDDAGRLAAEAVRVIEPVVRAHPDDPQLGADLLHARASVVDARLAGGGSPAPDEDLLALIALAETRLEARATTEGRLELSSLHLLVGRALARRGRGDAALEALESARRLAAVVAAEAPDDAAFRRRLAQVDEILGDTRAASGDLETGIADLQRAAAAYLELNGTDDRDVSRCLARLGRWHHASGHPVEAVDLLVQARARMIPLRERRPADRAVQAEFVATLRELSRVAAALGSGPTAVQYAQEALAATGRPSPGLLRDLAAAQALTGDPTRAVATIETALRLLDGPDAPADAARIRVALEADRARYRHGSAAAPE